MGDYFHCYFPRPFSISRTITDFVLFCFFLLCDYQGSKHNAQIQIVWLTVYMVRNDTYKSNDAGYCDPISQCDDEHRSNILYVCAMILSISSDCNVSNKFTFFLVLPLSPFLSFRLVFRFCKTINWTKMYETLSSLLLRIKWVTGVWIQAHKYQQSLRMWRILFCKKDVYSPC